MKTTISFLASAMFGLICLPAVWADAKCEAKSGTCQIVNDPTCDGMYQRGMCSGSKQRLCCVPISGGGCTETQKSLACQLLDSPNVVAREEHLSTIVDNAFAKTNLEDMCNGGRAARSSYKSDCECSAPGGTICLSEKLLQYVLDLSKNGKVTITELAGACHGCKSFHYAGLAVDLSWRDGRSAEYVKECEDDGGYGKDEGDHVHCQF